MEDKTNVAHEVKDGFKAFAAGTIAGFGAKIIEFPFDTVKVKLQTSKLYKGPLDCFRRTIRADGLAGLYRGLLTPLVGSMAENAISFTSYSRLQRLLQDDPRKPNLLPTLVSGMGAGFNVALLLTPVELIKCRLQVEDSRSRRYKGPLDCFRQTWRADGLRALYTGHTATMLREIPGGAAYFGMYEVFVKAFTPVGKTKDDVHPLLLACAGSCGGVAYWTIFFPADTVKSKMQTDSQSQGVVKKSSSFSSTFSSTFRKEGPKGLYAGLGVTLLRAVPSNFCIFFCYELTMRFLK